jgi:hypothetical protein
VKGGLRILLAIMAALPWYATYSAEPLGRLFFTPAQRNTLNAGKQLAVPRKGTPSGPRAAMLNGVVTRSDGESTIWVNGNAVSRVGSQGVNASTSASDPAAARVELQGTKERIKLKVGQRFDRSTGKVEESYRSAPVDTKQTAPDTTPQESPDQPPGRSRGRSRTAGRSDRDDDAPTNN